MADKAKGFKKMGTKKKNIIIGLAIAIVFNLYIQVIHKPLSGRIRKYRFQIEKSESRLSRLRKEFPQVNEERRNINALDTECERLLEEIAGMGKNLPSKKDASQLLGVLTKQAKDIKLISVRQKLDSGEEYSRIFFELRFNSPYKNTINYISKLESISPFLVIEELSISEPKGKRKEGGMSTRLLLSTLLGEIPATESIKAKETAGAIEVARDIFISKAKPASIVRKVELKLDGITYDPRTPTAIINGEVARIGSEVGNFTVKEIRYDMVILTDGVEDHILSIER